MNLHKQNPTRFWNLHGQKVDFASKRWFRSFCSDGWANVCNLAHAPFLAGYVQCCILVFKRICKTIATDPNPPLNVRSSPVSAPDNVVGKLRNGTQLTIVDENDGWLRISRPLEGWVYKELTVTSCVSAATARVANPTPIDNGSNILAEATEYYHSGNLEGAIALAQTVPANQPSYQLAQGTIVQWQQDWKVAETEFYASQKAVREGRWQDVLTKIKTFPDNRFWRGKMAPLVRASIQKQVETRR